MVFTNTIRTLWPCTRNKNPLLILDLSLILNLSANVTSSPKVKFEFKIGVQKWSTKVELCPKVV